MSRIDEALRRASMEASEHRAPLVGIQKPGCPSDGASLDHYPSEVDRTAQDGGQHQPSLSQALFRPEALKREWPQKPLDSKLVVATESGSMPVEQYRRLAAALHERQVEGGLKTLMVTSALPRDGKTLTVTNLALTLSASYGKRVLLIDADLRRPTVHEVLRIPNRMGLCEVLNARCETVPLVEFSPLLTVLTAGSPHSNPMAALTSQRMGQLLEHGQKNFDWVLLDAPPVGIMPDAGLLAGITGATLLVIGAGTTPYAIVQRAIAELGRDRIIGTVLNRIADDKIPATGYYGHYYGNSPSVEGAARRTS
jgi:capsular exopolysaccharide synthesis family protein